MDPQDAHAVAGTSVSTTNVAPAASRSQSFMSAREIIIVLLTAIVFTVLLTWPLASRMKSYAPDTGDGLLTAYIQAWDVHALTTSPRQLFNMNTFYPAKNMLARSENLLGTLPFFAPVYLTSQNANLANNVVIVSSFALCALAMYVLVKFATLDCWAAAIAAFIFAFSPVRIKQIRHMQLLSFEWMPLVVVVLVLAVITRRKRYFVASTALLFLQALCSVYLAFFALVVTMSYLAGAFLVHRSLFRRSVLVKLATAGLFFGVLMAPLAAQYRKVNKSGVFHADVAFMTAASANPIGSYLDIGTNSEGHVYQHLLRKHVSTEYDWEKNLFPGFVALLLAGCGTVAWLLSILRRNGTPGIEDYRCTVERIVTAGSLVSLVVSYVLSLGPYLRVHDQPTHIPLPFLWATKVLPGFSGIRVPARFGYIAVFSFAVLAGYGSFELRRWLARYRWSARPITSLLASGAVIAAMTVEFNFTPLQTYPVMTPATLAPEYRWLAHQARGSVTLELPISQNVPVGDPFEEAGYVYASTFDWQPLVNGYTGYPPPEAWERMPTLSRMPDAASVERARQLRVRFVLVHTDKMNSSAAEVWTSLPPRSGLKLVERFGPTMVFEVLPEQQPVAK
jgi:hypothetical protein